MKYGFAGDRKIALRILKFLIQKGYPPSILLVGDDESTTHADSLIEVSGLTKTNIITSSELKTKESITRLSELNLDYIIGIHYPYIIPSEILNIPKIGFLNLHPAYLPYNKGWHTPSWAIYDKTKYGATLHFMSEKLDEGDIIHQKMITIAPNDTGDSLYQKVLELEYEVFVEAFDQLISLRPERNKQTKKGSSHSKKDLKEIAKIELDQHYLAEDLIRKLRALTTNNVKESAFFEVGKKKYYIQINITEA